MKVHAWLLVAFFFLIFVAAVAGALRPSNVESLTTTNMSEAREFGRYCNKGYIVNETDGEIYIECIN